MNPGKLLEDIRALLQARSEEEAMQVLKDHPELLEDEADIMLQRMISNARKRDDAWEEKILAHRREFLHALRSSGSRESLEKGSELSHILKELSRPAQLGDMPNRTNLCQRALELAAPEKCTARGYAQSHQSLPEGTGACST